MTTANQANWIERRGAARLLEVPESRVNALAETGEIRTRDIPGLRARYRRDDVERLAKVAAAAPS